eukprot:Gb_33923 [translate_table: standard]
MASMQRCNLGSLGALGSKGSVGIAQYSSSDTEGYPKDGSGVYLSIQNLESGCFKNSSNVSTGWLDTPGDSDINGTKRRLLHTTFRIVKGMEIDPELCVLVDGHHVANANLGHGLNAHRLVAGTHYSPNFGGLCPVYQIGAPVT